MSKYYSIGEPLKTRMPFRKETCPECGFVGILGHRFNHHEVNGNACLKRQIGQRDAKIARVRELAEGWYQDIPGYSRVVTDCFRLVAETLFEALEDSR